MRSSIIFPVLILSAAAVLTTGCGTDDRSVSDEDAVPPGAIPAAPELAPGAQPRSPGPAVPPPTGAVLDTADTVATRAPAPTPPTQPADTVPNR